MLLDFPGLRTFLHVYAQRTVGRAEKTLHLARASISESLHDFEDTMPAGKLFERTPGGAMVPTRLADDLYRQAAPLVERLEEIVRQAQVQGRPVLRVGVTEHALHQHLLGVFARLRKDRPDLAIGLEIGDRRQLEAWVRSGRIHLGLATVVAPPAELNWRGVLQFQLALLVPAGRRITNVDTLWRRSPVEEPLVCPSAAGGVFESLSRGLARRERHWPVAVVANANELIRWAVINGLGLGACLAIKPFAEHEGVQTLPLDGFEPVTLGLFWQGQASPELQELMEMIFVEARCVLPTLQLPGKAFAPVTLSNDRSPSLIGANRRMGAPAISANQ